MLRGRFKAAAVTMAEQTVAAPPISALIASIPDDGFSEMPPLEQTAQACRSSMLHMLIIFCPSVCFSTKYQ